MRSRAPGRTALLAAVLAGAAAGALRAESRFLSPEGGVALAAGRSLRAAWLIGERGPRFHEMELVLSLDGGRTFPVRITRDLGPPTRSILLTVPSLPASHARLALRAGDGDEPGEEEILFVSEEFSITADPDRGLEPALFLRGEWRTRETLPAGERPALPDPATFGEGTPTIHALDIRLAACPPSPRLLADERSMEAPSILEGGAMERFEASAPLLSRAPADTPRRE